MTDNISIKAQTVESVAYELMGTIMRVEHHDKLYVSKDAILKLYAECLNVVGNRNLTIELVSAEKAA